MSMKPCSGYILLLIIFSSAITTDCRAQNKISNKTPPFLAETTESETSDEAEEIAVRFFDLAKNGNRSEWENLLSKECFKDDVPKEFVNRWYKQLSQTENVLQIVREKPAPRTNQKIFYYSYTEGSKNEKPVILVQEHGKWKVFQIKL